PSRSARSVPTGQPSRRGARTGGLLVQQAQEGPPAGVVDPFRLLAYSLPGRTRAGLAVAGAEGAALAGWQALDLGDPGKAWQIHEGAKAAARESGNATVLAHVTAQQAYALLDLERSDDALMLMQHARRAGQGRLPALFESWLWMAEAEALAACGREREARAAMEEASRLLPGDLCGEELPFLALDEAHIARWRGHCLARLGLMEAVDELTAAGERMDPSFTRAAASLHCDLALAYSMRGDHDAARQQAWHAAELAARTASAR